MLEIILQTIFRNWLFLYLLIRLHHLETVYTEVKIQQLL